MTIYPIRSFMRTAALVALCASSFAHSDIVGWGRIRFDSSWNQQSYTRVNAGWFNTQALRPDGTAVAFGTNFHSGELAYTNGMCEVPPLPPGLTYLELSGGEDHTLALRSNGSVIAWGDNVQGQLNVPALPPGLTYVEVDAAWVTSLARRSDGSVIAWGANWWGQLSVPPLPGGLTYVEVSAGYDHCLARRSDGSVVAWGSNGFGQCSVPALPPGLTYTQISARGWNATPLSPYASHSVARRSDGSAVAWGDNAFGQCNVPALPSGLTFAEIRAGSYHTVARLSDGSVIAWGRNDKGQCNVPAPPAGAHYVAVAAGCVHSVALLDTGKYVAWGGNDTFQCGVPAPPSGVSFVEVSSGSGGGAYFGGSHALARLSDGTVLAWGSNDLGQCDVPALPPGVTYVEVDGGAHSYSVARRSDGSVVAWGDNSSGQCNVPVLPQGVSFAEVAAGDRHVVARGSDGSVIAWGDNTYGQCNVPALPPGLSYTEVVASYRNSAARRSDGSVVVWGDNSAGQCNTPAPPSGVTYVEVELGYLSTVARRSDGSVIAWGNNVFGQCNVPALPSGLTYVEISAADQYFAPWSTLVASNTLARRSDGALVVWGDTSAGQAIVPAFPAGQSVTEIEAGGAFTIARLEGGALCTDWNLARDFRVFPAQANPNPDVCGTPGVWHFLESNPATFPAHDPAGYTLLPEFLTNHLNTPGLEAWQGTHFENGPTNKLPSVVINNTGALLTLGPITWPANVVGVHPLKDLGDTEFVIVGWRSPLTGTVTVSGGVAELNSCGNDGIGWSIDHFDGQTNTNVASGSIPNGGAQQFQNGAGGTNLTSVAVNQGDFLYFLVDPQADMGCDSTALDIVITPAVGCGTWSNYCAATPNSSGVPARIWCSGSLNVAANDMRLHISQCPPQRAGIFFFGQYGAQIPLADGYLCVSPFAPGLFRLFPVVWTDANGHGERNLDFITSGPTGLITPGSTWHFQFWYRDWIPGGSGSNLSDGMRVTFCP